MSSHEAGLLKGRKVSNKHSTVIAAARPIIEQLKALPEVSKVVVGLIKHAPGQKVRVKAAIIEAGLRVTVRGNGAVQELYAYTSAPEAVAKAVEHD